MPVVGEPCDGIDAAISFARGDQVGGLLSVGSMVPVAGWGSAAVKGFRNADRLREILRIVELLRNGCKVGSSFVPGTRVLRGDGGSESIEDIRVGDTVLAAEPVIGRTAPKAVTALLGSDGDKRVVDVAVDDDGDPRTPPCAVSAT